jgi:light-regulated signal transduction histidine kinase (bacteriophytochrome)
MSKICINNLDKLDMAKVSNQNKQLQEIMFVLSHDLNAPVRKIKGFSYLLEDQYANRLDDNAKEWLAFLTEESDKIENLLAGVSRYASIWTNADPIVEVNIESLVDQIVSTLNTGDSFDIECVNLPILFGIESLWYILIFEIISNAIFFQPENQRPKMNITFSMDETGGQLQFSDNGLGVKEKFQQKLTTIFYHYHEELPSEGNGIGLTLCQRILERHNGYLSINSNLKNGLTVNCHLLKDYISSYSP